MFKRYPILILILIVTLWGGALNAQVRSTDIVLEISPENPSPNQNINARLSSYVTDMNKAYISWSVNGEKKSGGIGKTSFSFNTEEDSNIELIASIETTDGQNLTKTQRISPVNVDMLWEAYDSYVPPFYKGKALVPREGGFKVVAIPNINTRDGKLNQNNLSYTWEKDGQGQVSLSGWGKSSFVFYNNYLDNNNVIDVKITDISGKTTTEGKIILQTSTPKILFYEKDTVLGTKLEKTIDTGTFEIKKEGTALVAIPYFISPKKLSSPDLQFDWYINDQKVITKEPRNEIGLKPESGKNGEAIINLILSNTKAIFTGTKSELTVKF